MDADGLDQPHCLIDLNAKPFEANVDLNYDLGGPAWRALHGPCGLQFGDGEHESPASCKRSCLSAGDHASVHQDRLRNPSPAKPQCICWIAKTEPIAAPGQDGFSNCR